MGAKSEQTQSEIKKLYWKLSLLVHPDKCSHPKAKEAFDILNKAKKVLLDPAQRKVLDEKLEDAKLRAEFEEEMSAKRSEAQWRKMRGESLPGDEELLDPTANEGPSRDTWMTELPPEYKAGGMPTARQFSRVEKRGRGDTSGWTDTPEMAQKRAQGLLGGVSTLAIEAAQMEAEREKNASTAALVDTFNEKKRGKSLMEKHQQERSKKSKKAKKSKDMKKASATNADADEDDDDEYE